MIETFDGLNCLQRQIANPPHRRHVWMRRLLPVHYVHHIQWSFGYVPLAWLPWAFGIFTEPRTGASILRLVRRRDYHDCTATGIY